MPDAISKPMNFPGRNPAVAVAPRKRRWWIAAIVAGALMTSAAGVVAYWYLNLCRNCGPIICDDPCTLPTFSRMWEPASPVA